MLPNPSVAVFPLKNKHTQTHTDAHSDSHTQAALCLGKASGKHGLDRRPIRISVPPLGHASRVHWDKRVSLDQHSRQKATGHF